MATSDTVTCPQIVAGTMAGPASYTAGGYVHDLSASLSFLNFYQPTFANLMAGVTSVRFEITLNNDGTGFAQGKALVKVLRVRYDKPTVGTVASLPAGVAAQSVKFAAAASETGHGHGVDHDHAAASTSGFVAGGGGVATGGGTNLQGHNHSADIGAYTGNTTSNNGHPHDRSFEYIHTHAAGATTVTDVVTSEIAAGTNLSSITFGYLAMGQ